jgi:methylmalonyl-CoA mutase
MNTIFSEFQPSSEVEWKDAITKALKGPSIEEALHYSDPIEGIHYKAYTHPSSVVSSDETPGQMPYTRGGKFQSNHFEIVNILPSGEAKQRNKTALDLLMKGATALRIDLENHTTEECTLITEGIGFEFIITTFICHNTDQFRWVQSLRNEKNIGRIHVFSSEEIEAVDGLRTRLIDGTQVTNFGGNCKQELAYLLHEGHTQLYQLIAQGKSVDDAAAQLKFRIGIGSNYFFQIAKIRAFRHLWSTLVAAYKPTHSCSHIPFIEAETSIVNKSVKDPYTNLLRLTTEALSAIIAGVDELTVLPYDWGTKQPNLEKSQRLSTNISLILKEESYLEKVVDPGGGAYALEALTTALEDEAWKLFQQVEEEGVSFLQKEILATEELRKEHFKAGKTTLLGINKFPNPEKVNNEWLAPKQLVFGQELILERDVITAKA